MAEIWDDVRYALRQLRQAPTFPVAIITCFALGIGANAVVFEVVDTLFLRAPAHIQDSRDVVRVYVHSIYPGRGEFYTSQRSYPQYLQLRGGVAAFSSAAGYSPVTVTIGDKNDAQQVNAILVSSTFFSLLGVQGTVGRLIDETDDRPNADPAVVLGYGLWVRRFGADSSVIGKGLRIGERFYTVIGVAPRGFTGVDLAAADAFLPISIGGPQFIQEDALQTPFSGWVSIIGRLGGGVTLQVAQQQATAAYLSGRAPPSSTDPQVSVILAPIQSARGPKRAADAVVAMWVAGVSLMVLLISCANIGNLLLVRGLRRRREVGIRLAIGASRARMWKALLAEGMVLALLGAVVALVAAWALGPILYRFFLPESAPPPATEGGRLIEFILVAAVLGGVASGAIPAFQSIRPGLATALATGEREGGGRRTRLGMALLVIQVAFSLVLLIGTGLFVESAQRVGGADVGVDPKNVLVAEFQVRGTAYTGARVTQLYQQALQRLQSVPGIEAASIAYKSPFRGGWSAGVTLGGGQEPVVKFHGEVNFNAVSPDYFRSLGLPVLRGRGISATDVAGTERVAVVNEAMAIAMWPGQNPIGKCFRHGDDPECTFVVGVTKNVPILLSADPTPQFYTALLQTQSSIPLGALIVRTSDEPGLAAPRLREGLLSMAADVPYVRMSSLATELEPQMRPWRLGRTMFAVYGLLALCLTSFGLYGVLSYWVTQGTREIGIRIALGAGPGFVRRSVVLRAVALVGCGVALGLAAVLAGGRFVTPLLFRTSAHDPLILASASMVLVVVAVGASYGPALRATRVDPTVALRYE